MSPAKTIEQWVERNLTVAARKGQLQPAYEIEDAVQSAAELLEAGRNPILTGDPGVGKTAIVYEIVRRSSVGLGPARLAGRRILELSFQRRMSTLKNAYEVHDEFQRLVQALCKYRRKLALFIRDIHLAYALDLERELCALAYEFGGPVIAEGPEAAVTTLLEDDQVLQQYYTPVCVDEPTLSRTLRILRSWGHDEAGRCGRAFTDDALEEAMTLTHRFLARSRLPRKAIDLLRHTASRCAKEPVVEAADVIERFCAMHQTPRALVDPSIPLDLDQVRRRFEQTVFGQRQAIESMVDMIGVLKAGLTDLRRPLGAFLLVGPTGVGKTYVAQILAEHLFGRRDRLVRLNMADFPNESDAQVLFGDPADTKEACVRGLLTARLAGCPFGVVLLDEFEKSHPKVHDRFLQLIDEGAFVNGAGETISCRSLIIVATSNAGSELHRGGVFGFSAGNGSSQDDRRAAALERCFRFELLNRFDRVVHFGPLSLEDIRGIARQELRLLCQRIGVRRRGLRVLTDWSVIDWIAERGFSPNHGARVLRRTLEQCVTTALAGAIVRENPAPGAQIRLMLEGQAVVARVVDGAEPAADSDRGGPAKPARRRAERFEWRGLRRRVREVVT
ncbi:MAG: ATP-dependent Clp protease ATP-binding subunit [bacterium]|nr:ATP-dependent Clp protease ATP-binding subunit [bacterium]